MFDLDQLQRDQHQPWSARDRLPRDAKLTLIRYRVDLPDGETDTVDATSVQLNSLGVLLFFRGSHIVAGFNASGWHSWQRLGTVDDESGEIVDSSTS